MHRLKSQKYDNEKKEMERVIRELDYKFEDTKELYDQDMLHL